MAFFKNYSAATVSHSILEENSRGQNVNTLNSSSQNENVDGSLSMREFDMNVDAQYQSDDEPYETRTVQNDGIRVSNSQPSGRRTANAGQWGSSFWKDCKPLCPPRGSDSGQDSKSGSDNKYAERPDDNLTDAWDSDDDEGQDEVAKGQRGHPDVPAEEMLSDEYYEQDGDDQSDRVPYRADKQPAGINSRPSIKVKPSASSRNVSRNSRTLNVGEDDDFGDDGDDKNDDADYEDEDEEDEDDPHDADFDPDGRRASSRTAKQDEDWDAEASDEDDVSEDEVDVSDEEVSYYSKKPKGKQGSKGAHTAKSSKERTSLPAYRRQNRGKSYSDEEESSAKESGSESFDDLRGTTSRGAQRRKSNARLNMSASNNRESNEVRTSTRSTRKVSYVESDESDDADEAKKKKSQKEEVEEEEGDSIEKVLWHQPKGMAEESLRNNRPAEPILLSHLFASEPDWNDMEFLIKWKGQSHLHCQWKSLADLQNLSGFKKVLNYTKKVTEDVKYRMSFSREEIEVNDVSKEMDLDLIKQYSQVERVISDRLSKDGSGDVVVPEYLVKWQGLSYAEATWYSKKRILWS